MRKNTFMHASNDNTFHTISCRVVFSVLSTLVMTGHTPHKVTFWRLDHKIVWICFRKYL